MEQVEVRRITGSRMTQIAANDTPSDPSSKIENGVVVWITHLENYYLSKSHAIISNLIQFFEFPNFYTHTQSINRTFPRTNATWIV